MKEHFSEEYIQFLEQNKLLPLKETSKMLNMHPATLRSLAKSNYIKHARIGKKYYFNIQDIKIEGYKKQDLPLGIVINNGYIKVNVGTSHPSADANGYIALHRLIMESYLKRPLKSNEIVHHKNGSTLDNKLMNLEALPDLPEHARKYKSMEE